MQTPSVLILASDAQEYLPLLEDLAAGGAALSTVAETVGEAHGAYAGQTVILGQPDLVAEAAR